MSTDGVLPVAKTQDAATAAGIKWFLNLFSGAGNAKAAAAGQAVAGASRGAFGGPNLAQGLRLGSTTTQEKIEKNTARAADDLDEIKDKVGGVKVD